MIYPVDSTIQRLNNRALVYHSSYHVTSSACPHATQIYPWGETKRFGATFKTYPLDKTKQFGGDVLDKVQG